MLLEVGLHGFCAGTGDFPGALLGPAGVVNRHQQNRRLEVVRVDLASPLEHIDRPLEISFLPLNARVLVVRFEVPGIQSHRLVELGFRFVLARQDDQRHESRSVEFGDLGTDLDGPSARPPDNSPESQRRNRLIPADGMSRSQGRVIAMNGLLTIQSTMPNRFFKSTISRNRSRCFWARISWLRML